MILLLQTNTKRMVRKELSSLKYYKTTTWFLPALITRRWSQSCKCSSTRRKKPSKVNKTTSTQAVLRAHFLKWNLFQRRRTAPLANRSIKTRVQIFPGKRLITRHSPRQMILRRIFRELKIWRPIQTWITLIIQAELGSMRTNRQQLIQKLVLANKFNQILWLLPNLLKMALLW